MPIVGSNKNPVMIKGKRKGKKLGSTGRWAKPENKKNYDENWDAIFGKKDTETNLKAK